MKKQTITLLLVFSSIFLFGQSPKKVLDGNEGKKGKDTSIGINYFGELGLRPGIEVDYGIGLWKKDKETEKRIFTNQFNIRPSLAYYRYANYSDNILLSLKLNYQLRFKKKTNDKYLFVEPSARIGLLRYFLAGDVYETQEGGLKEVNFRGSNSIIFGGGLDIGGYLSQRSDWLLGFDYFAEGTEDKLTLHRFVLKLGTRIKINK